MSKQVDERVVSMQFDNKHFEKNVSTTMGTLDKLKQSLKLTGASKGLENMQSAANKIDFSKMEGTVCQAGFHIEDVWQKLSSVFEYQIARRIVNAATSITNALTIAPITTGFNEYELKMNSVQTIMASTGESIDTVNRYLEELNKYSDQTIYSFSDMTQNIGKFTNAGVKLEDAVMAIKGISNEAAVSGANANEASRAMYNFSQALSAGYVKLIDWKSIENANMATMEFKEQLIATALELGTITKASDGMYETLEGNAFNAAKNFNEVFQDQWMTSDVLIKTLKKYASETTDIGKKAKAAATEIKTISQLYDTLKESAQSGWAQTWEYLVGDLVEAKDVLTNISKAVGGFIDKMSDARNKLLGGALTSKWEKLIKVIGNAGLKVDDYESIIKNMVNGKDTNAFDNLIEKYGSLRKAVEAGAVPVETLKNALRKLLGMQEDLGKSTGKMTDSMKDYQKVVKEVIRGEWGSGEKRWKALADAGYDWAKVQNMVNEELGNSVRHLETLSEEQIANAKTLGAYTEEQLKSMGYTEEQIIALKDLNRAAKTTDETVDELFSDMTKKSGRDLLIESFTHIFEEIGKLFEAFGEAWNNVFDPIDSDDLYDVIEAFHELVSSMSISETTADNFRRILEGIFSAFDLTWSVASMSFMGGLKILNAILELFGTDIMGAAAKLADYITQFNEWVEGQAFFGAATKWDDIAAVIKEILLGVVDCFKALIGLEKVQGIIEAVRVAFGAFLNLFGDFDGEFTVDKVVEAVKTFFDNIEAWIKNLDNIENVGEYIVDGIIKGLTEGLPKALISIGEIAWGMIKEFCRILGIESPSKKFAELAGYVVSGIVNGIINGAKKVFTAIGNLGSNMVKAFQNSGVPDFFGKVGEMIKNGFMAVATFFSNIDWGAVIAVGLSIGFILAIKAVADALALIAKPLQAFTKLFGQIGGAFDKLGDYFKAKAFHEKAKAVKEVAIAVLILATGIFLLASIEDTTKLWQAVVAIGILTAAMAGLLVAVNYMSKVSGEFSKDGVKLQGMNTGMLAIAGALIAIIGAVAIFGKMSREELERGFTAVAGVMVGLLVFAGLLSVVTSFAKDYKNIGSNLLKMAAALVILAFVMKLLKNMEWSEMGTAFAGLTGLVGIMALLMKVTKIGNTKKVGGMLLKMAGVLAVLAIVMKLMGSMKWEEMGKAGAGMLGLVGIMAIMMKITKLGTEKQVAQAGAMVASLAGAMLMLTITGKLLASMSWTDMGKAVAGLAGLAVVVGVLVWITQLAKNDAAKIGATLMALSTSIAILAVVAILLSLVKPEGLAKGVAVVAALAIIMGILVTSLRGAQNVYKSLIWITISIALLAGAIALLTLLDTKEALGSAIALSAVLAAYSLVVRSLNGMKGFQKGALPALATMVVITALLGAVVYGLSYIPNPQGALISAVAVGGLIAVCTAMMPKLAAVGNMAKLAAKGALVLAEMSLALAGFGFVLASMSNTKNAIPNAIALSALVAVCSLMMPKLTACGTAAASGAPYLGVLALLEMALPLAAFALILASMSNVKNAIPNAIALSALVAVCSLMLPILTGVGAAGMTGAPYLGALALLAMALPLATFAIVLAGMNDVKNSITNALALSVLVLTCSTMLVVLSAVGAAFPLALLGLVALNTMAEDMTVFVDLLKGMQGIEDAEANAAILTSLLNTFTDSLVQLSLVAPLAAIGVDAIDELIEIITSLIGFAMVVAGLMDVMPFIRDLMDNGIQLIDDVVQELGGIIVKFATGFGEIPPEAVQNIKGLVEAVKTITDASLMAQLSTLAGMSVDEFGAQLSTFGYYLAAFSENINGKISMEAVEAAKNAGLMMAELANTIQKTGELISMFTGYGDLGTFGDQLATFGWCVTEFFKAIQNGGVSLEAVETAKVAGEMMVALANTIPKTGGLIDMFEGYNDLSTFGSQLMNFGLGISAFSKTVSDLDVDAITKSVTAATELSKLQSGLEKTGGLESLFSGDKGLGNFGNNIKKLGYALSSYYYSIEDVNFSSVGSSVKYINSLMDMAKGMSGVNFDNMSKFGDSLKNLAKTGIDSFVLTFAQSSGRVKTAGKELIENVVDGIKNKVDSLREAAKTVSKNGASGVSDAKSSFESAGKDLGDGLVAGIEAKVDDAYDAGYALGQAAVQGEKDGQQSNSPSKLTEQAGNWLGEGLIIGMRNMTSKVYSAGRSLGDTAATTLSSTIAKISESINGDIDSQPTIRPVLDLSDVTAGASTISGLFNNPSIGMMSNVRSISSSMNSRQNGANSDVVSALADLRNTLNNRPTGNTYTINGVNFTQGDDVAEAFETIIRAARVERRA